MFYIFNTENVCIGSCDNNPCADDLASRGEYLLEFDGDCKVDYTDDSGTPVPPVVIPPTPEEVAAATRNQRNAKLMDFDRKLYRNQFFWSTLTAEQQAERLSYRQALLDVPQQTGFPDDVIWTSYPTL